MERVFRIVKDSFNLVKAWSAWVFVCGRTWVLGLVWLIKLIMKLVGVVAEKVVGVLAVVGNVGVVVDAPQT